MLAAVPCVIMLAAVLFACSTKLHCYPIVIMLAAVQFAYSTKLHCCPIVTMLAVVLFRHDVPCCPCIDHYNTHFHVVTYNTLRFLMQILAMFDGRLGLPFDKV